jgi:hypothetical protein
MRLPADWKHVLTMVQSADSRAIIAGGALRDLDCLRPVKDVDIFIPAHSCDMFARIVEYVERTMSIKTDYTMGKEYREHFNNITGVASFVSGNTQFDLVGLDMSDPLLVINKFDFGICQISHDGVLCRTTQAYANDKKNNTFTHVPSDNYCEESIIRSMRRWNRLQAKYDAWPMILPYGPKANRSDIEWPF